MNSTENSNLTHLEIIIVAAQLEECNDSSNTESEATTTSKLERNLGLDSKITSPREKEKHCFSLVEIFKNRDFVLSNAT